VALQASGIGQKRTSGNTRGPAGGESALACQSQRQEASGRPPLLNNVDTATFHEVDYVWGVLQSAMDEVKKLLL